jgi:hypothetical protein
MQQHPLELEIRTRLSAYVTGKISLREFTDWFFPATWNVHKLGDLSLMDLVGEIELDWAEYTNGDWSEDELREMFKPLATQLTMSPPSMQQQNGTSSRNMRPMTTTYPGKVADIKSSMVYG